MTPWVCRGVRPHDLRHHAATVIARNPNVTLRVLMATIGHASPVAALRYQHATAERSKVVASYLDDVIKSAQGAQASAGPHPLVSYLRGIWRGLRNTVKS